MLCSLMRNSCKLLIKVKQILVIGDLSLLYLIGSREKIFPQVTVSDIYEMMGGWLSLQKWFFPHNWIWMHPSMLSNAFVLYYWAADFLNDQPKKRYTLCLGQLCLVFI
jgi:hypothetical protein